MLYLITGGSGSGKSAYAESCMDDFEGPKYYIATMQIFDAEGEKKIERHRRLRQGKGFLTIEQPVDLAKIELCGNGLLECMSNLVANEMFRDGKMLEAENVTAKILADVNHLRAQMNNLVIVTNNVFEDGMTYDTGTMEYLKALGTINTALAEMAEVVIEVVVGIPLTVKEVTCLL